MMTLSRSFDLRSVLKLSAREELIRDLQSGLGCRPRSLIPWMLYHDEGSRLFERITMLPEYYPSRTERAILARHADEILAAVCRHSSRSFRVVELGAGTAWKTSLLLTAATHRHSDVVYMPIDVSRDALERACERIVSLLPGVQLDPFVLNYLSSPPKLERFNDPMLALYLGSSIGNFVPEGAQMILRNLKSQLHEGDALLLGTDLVKSKQTLSAAYDDAEGVTAAFNLNLLDRLNRELGGNFDRAWFQHLAFWSEENSRIEMHLESMRSQEVRIEAADLYLQFNRRETIHTENSYKFTDCTCSTLLERSGFDIEKTWEGPERVVCRDTSVGTREGRARLSCNDTRAVLTLGSAGYAGAIEL
jgi:L-histidine Nalpha-methyltransferase